MVLFHKLGWGGVWGGPGEFLLTVLMCIEHCW